MKFSPGVPLVALLLVGATPLWAGEELVGSYTAKLSRQDHVSRDGHKLIKAADILARDREIHAKGHPKNETPDSEDGDCEFFEADYHRSDLGDLLNNGVTKKPVIAAIEKGTPTVKVSVWKSAGGEQVALEVVIVK